jgi:hypothetical protein
MTDRMRLRDELILSLGFLLDPIRRVIFQEPLAAISRHERLGIEQQFKRDLKDWCERLDVFCDCMGVKYELEYSQIEDSLVGLHYKLNCTTSLSNLELLQACRRDFQASYFNTIELIRAVPVEIADLIFQSDNPYRSYLLFRSLCSNASKRIEIFDPYLDATVFHRYLCDLQPDVDVKVITDETIMLSRRRQDEVIRDRIVAVSELLAHERPDQYRLLVVRSLHDRHLRVDDDLFHLGGSLKDAAKNDPFTLGRLDATDAVNSVLDGYVSAATPWYQPGMPNHRRS